jgi:hypothetical protein
MARYRSGLLSMEDVDTIDTANDESIISLLDEIEPENNTLEFVDKDLIALESLMEMTKIFQNNNITDNDKHFFKLACEMITGDGPVLFPNMESWSDGSIAIESVNRTGREGIGRMLNIIAN